MKVLKKHPVVDYGKCVGCHSCERKCPTEAMRVLPLSGLKKETAPCTIACPAHIDVCGYVGLIANKRYAEAYELIMQENPFPSVCGRICTHPCEAKCNRGKKDKPVAIRELKRFVTDLAYQDGEPTSVPGLPDNGKTVGVIGAGPSGLSCAYYLRLLGYEVHVYEEEAMAGGVLAYGIPEYRLPKAILQREINHIVNTGIHLHLNCSVGKDISFNELKSRHQAIYLATGTKFSKKMEVSGEDKSGVIHGLDFLHAVNTGKKVSLGQKLVVVGGGNTAIDVARTAVRLGCKDVTILYRRRRIDMPAEKIEILEAREEGVKILELASPVEILGDDNVTGIRCSRMRTIGDKGGRLNVEPVEESEFVIECDMVIPAVSQYFDLPFMREEELKLSATRTLAVDEETMMTSKEGIFGGGDMSRGPDIAIHAIADGKKAAIRIDYYLGGEGKLNKGKCNITLPVEQHTEDLYAAERPREKYLSREERKGTMKECLLGYDEETALAEAKRCLRCESNYKAVSNWDDCIDCGFCTDFCPNGAVTFVNRDTEKPLPIEIKKEDREKVLEMCRNAKIYPRTMACQCMKITAGEVCAAILEGYTTVDGLIKRLGLLSACGKYCASVSSRLLEMNGYPQKEELKYGKVHLHAYTAIRDVPLDEALEKFPELKPEQDPTYFYVDAAMTKPEIWWPDQKK